ncbi:MAG: DUF4330 family protein [Clostridia bacterium]|nr:DUF4330 family protein [Clostridia bacterium]
MESKKYRFNIVDVFIILIILGAVALLGYVFIFSNKTVEKYETHEVECVVEVTRVNELFRDKFSQGDAVINPSNNRQFGTVTEAPERKRSVTTAFDEKTGNEVYPEVEGADDYIITFVGTADKTEWGYRFADMYINVAEQCTVQIGDMQCMATCIKMTVLD